MTQFKCVRSILELAKKRWHKDLDELICTTLEPSVNKGRTRKTGCQIS